MGWGVWCCIFGSWSFRSGNAMQGLLFQVTFILCSCVKIILRKKIVLLSGSEGLCSVPGFEWLPGCDLSLALFYPSVKWSV